MDLNQALRQSGVRIALLRDAETDTTRLVAVSEADYGGTASTGKTAMSISDEPIRDAPRYGCYSIYVLVLLLLAYTLNQIDRYLLAICILPIAQELEFGDVACTQNLSYFGQSFQAFECSRLSTQQSCENATTAWGDVDVCEWNYNGQGYEYQLLAGPVYTIVYTSAGLILGLVADFTNRKFLLALCVLVMSVDTIFTGSVATYWELAVTRFILGFGEAGCTPFATSLIGDYFRESYRGAALGLYNWGIDIGYGLAFVFGDFITSANIMDQGWRWAFYCAGIPGVLLAIIMVFTVREPERCATKRGDKMSATDLFGDKTSVCGKIGVIISQFTSSSLLLLCLAGSIRNAAGYVWSYNAALFYESGGEDPAMLGRYMSWVPVIGGSVSVLVGGALSDWVAIKHGAPARILIIAVGLLVAAPCAAAALVLDTPYAFFILLPCYMLGEVWVSVSLVVLIELVPTALRTSSVAFYLFIISNVAGLAPMLVPVLEQTFIQQCHFTTLDALRASLLVLFPGAYLVSAFIYILVMVVIQRDLERHSTSTYTNIKEEGDTLKPAHSIIQLHNITIYSSKLGKLCGIADRWKRLTAKKEQYTYHMDTDYESGVEDESSEHKLLG